MVRAYTFSPSVIILEEQFLPLEFTPFPLQHLVSLLFRLVLELPGSTVVKAKTWTELLGQCLGRGRYVRLEAEGGSGLCQAG